MKPLVIGIGEILWDLLPSGARMGGAPANFACHARALGAEAQTVSRVGEDDPGTRLLENLIEFGLPISGISVDPNHDTIGAGDSFTAAVTMGMLNHWPIDRISEAATEVAAHVCSRPGAVPVLPESILTRFELEAATT